MLNYFRCTETVSSHFHGSRDKGGRVCGQIKNNYHSYYPCNYKWDSSQTVNYVCFQRTTFSAFVYSVFYKQFIKCRACRLGMSIFLGLNYSETFLSTNLMLRLKMAKREGWVCYHVLCIMSYCLKIANLGISKQTIFLVLSIKEKTAPMCVIPWQFGKCK